MERGTIKLGANGSSVVFTKAYSHAPLVMATAHDGTEILTRVGATGFHASHSKQETVNVFWSAQGAEL